LIVRGAVVLSLLALIVVGGGLTLLRWGNDTSIEDFRHEVVLSRSEAGEEMNTVAHNLVDRWFRYFTTSAAARAARIQDYRIDRIEVMRVRDRLFVSATLQVKPTRWSFDNWLAGSGGTVQDGWIRGKFMRFALTDIEEGYKLQEIGPGPQ
jgi:hypothetical protein